MPSVRVKNELNDGIYFLTFTVKRWYYLFDRHQRWEILLDSLIYCQKNKDIKIYSWVFMLNHIHLIINSNDVSGFIRDFKKFTSKRLKENIADTEPTILKLFLENGKYEFWKKTNMPEKIESEKFFTQKKRYIENNPIRKQYVQKSEDWVYSSANPEKLISIDNI